MPANLFDAARTGNLPGLVFFSVLIGIALTRIRSEHAQPVSAFFAGLAAATIRQ